ncbi:MAG: hypothetical protein QOD38_573, partial [Acidimicrobiaceae bacterium]
RHHLPRAMIVPLLNSSAFLKNRDVDAARSSGREAVELTLQVGARDLLRSAAMNLALTCWVSGDWDEAEALHTHHQDDFASYSVDLMTIRAVLVFIRTARDEPVDFEMAVPQFDAGDAAGEYVGTLTEALIADANGDADGAAVVLARAVDVCHRAFGIDDDFAVLWPFAVERVLAAGHTSEAERLLRFVADSPPGLVTPLAHAHLLRLRALVRIATDADAEGIDTDLELASQEFRDFGTPFYLARSLLERAHRIAARGDGEAAAPLLEEAEAVFTGLRANRWVAETRGVSSLR